MSMRGYLLGICFFLFEGCTQPNSLGWNHISCDYTVNRIAPYSLEALEREHECKKVEEVQQ